MGFLRIGRRPICATSYGPHLRLIAYGTSIGPATGTVIDALLARCIHPEQGCRACAALTMRYPSVASMLTTALDTIPVDTLRAGAHERP